MISKHPTLMLDAVWLIFMGLQFSILFVAPDRMKLGFSLCTLGMMA
jgi:hypothetical protein